MLTKKVTNRGKKAAAILGAALMTTGVTVSASMPIAAANNGSPDPNTGIVWGTGNDGSYMIPINGGEVQGYCLDAGLMWPRQGGNNTPYSEPVPWGGQLSKGDRQRLFLALLAGKAVANGQIPQDFINMLNQNAGLINAGLATIHQPPINTDFGNPDDIAAGVSYIVHDVGSHSPDNKGNWDPGRMDNPKGRNFFDTVNRLSDLWSSVPIFPNVDQLTAFKIRTPQDSLAGRRQRMISMDDIRLELPNITIPNITIPPETPETPKTPTTPTTPETPTEPKTPSTTTTPPRKTKTSTITTTNTKPGITNTTTNTETNTRTSTSTTTSTNTTTNTRTVTGTPETSTVTSGTTTPFTPYSETPKTTTPKEEKPEVQIRTSAGEKSSNVVEVGRTITDTVTYQGLTPKKKYTIVGELVDKKSGKKTGDRAVAKFETKTANGNVDIQIPVKNADSDEIVVFETLFDEDGKKVAEHHDIKDRAQTVGRPLSTPEIRTSADSSTGNNIQSGTTVNDTVYYKGLVKGRNYRLQARLMCVANGQDTGANQTHDFVAEESNGSTVVSGIQVTSPDCLKQVAFEKLYEVKDNGKGVLVATHEDINDQAQTFGGDHVAKKKKKIAPKKKAPKPVTKTTTVPTPSPVAPVAPAPASVPGVQSVPVPRQIIKAVPSGESSTYGRTIFDR